MNFPTSQRISLIFASSKTFGILAAVFLLVFSPALAAEPPAVSLQFPDHLKMKSQEVKTVRIDVSVRPGFHVQANPASHENLIPTEVLISATSGYRFSPPKYPKGTIFRLDQVGTTLSTYSGNFQIAFDVLRTRPVKDGESSSIIRGKVHYQACDDKTCLRPNSIPFEFTVDNP